MNKSLVSVIMPVYNSERYLYESLNSILVQTYRDIEVIIVDDGCTDGSMKIVDSFHDQRIRIIRNQQNVGLAASLNKAIHFSRGVYLARMDADDISYPQRIEKQVEYLENHPEVDVMGSAMKFMGHSRYVGFFPQTHEGCRVQLLFNVCFGHPTVMFRRKSFESPENQYDESLKQYSEEYDLWCRLVSRCRFGNLNEVLLLYRIHPPEAKRDAELLRRRNSLVIQKAYLTLTLGQVTLSEMAIHARLSLMEEIRTKEELISCDNWMKRIVTLNKERMKFNERELVNLLAHRFFEFCYHNTGLGLASVSYYYKSDWFGFYQPPFKLRVMQLLKTLLRTVHH